MIIRPVAMSIAVLVVAALALGACDAMPGRPRPEDRTPIPTEVMDFAALYGRHCAGCHGAEGHSGPARPLDDPVYLALIPRDRLRAAITGAEPNTPATLGFRHEVAADLTDRQLDALVDGMLARWASPEAVANVAPPPYDAQSGPTGDPAFLALVSDQALRTTVIAGRPDLGMPDWRASQLGRPLTPQEISDVVAWLVARRGSVPGRPAASVQVKEGTQP